MTLGGFEVEKKVSLGHLVTIITVIVGLGIGWQALAGETAKNTKDNERQDEALSSMLSTINADRLENQKLLTEMRVDIRYLRRSEEAAKRAEEDEQ
jgi:hypothetical protein